MQWLTLATTQKIHTEICHMLQESTGTSTGSKSREEPGAPLLVGQTERVGVVHTAEVKALGDLRALSSI